MPSFIVFGHKWHTVQFSSFNFEIFQKCTIVNCLSIFHLFYRKSVISTTFRVDRTKLLIKFKKSILERLQWRQILIMLVKSEGCEISNISALAFLSLQVLKNQHFNFKRLLQANFENVYEMNKIVKQIEYWCF